MTRRLHSLATVVMGDISLVPLHTQKRLVESGMNQRCFPANFQSPAEPATAAGAALGKKRRAPTCPPPPCPYPGPSPCFLESPARPHSAGVKKVANGVFFQHWKEQVVHISFEYSKSWRVGFKGSAVSCISASLWIASICPKSSVESTLAPLEPQ